MILSCGLIIFNRNLEVLIGHPTFYPMNAWNVPKGRQEEGETNLQTALRETFEETNLKFNENNIKDQVFVKNYTKTKDLYLFSVYSPVIDISKVKCNSFVNDDIDFPEFDDFKFITIKDLDKYIINKNLIKGIKFLYERLINSIC